MPDWKWYPQFAGLVRDPEGKHYKKMGMAKWLFDFLCAEADRKTGAWAGRLCQISERTGMPMWTVKRYERALKKGGYITVSRKIGITEIRISKYKTLVMQENGAPKLEDISMDRRKPLEKNKKSRLYVAPHAEMQEYFKGVLKCNHLGNHDDYVLLQMYWDGVPFVVIQNAVEDLLAKAKGKSIFTVRYFKDAIYESHKKYTHKLEPERGLMSGEAAAKKERFHALAGKLARGENHDAEKSEESV